MIYYLEQNFDKKERLNNFVQLHIYDIILIQVNISRWIKVNCRQISFNSNSLIRYMISFS